MKSHKKISYLFMTLLITNFISSCSLFSSKIPGKEKEKIKKIAILSDLGTKFNYEYAGAIAARNRHQDFTGPWDMDQQIGNALLETLKTNSQYEKIELVGGELSKRPYFDQMITAKRNGEKIKPYLEKLATMGFDTFIIVQTWRQLEDSSLTPGYGFHYDNRLLIHDQNFYLTAKVRVYNILSKKEIAALDFWENPFLPLEDFAKRKTYQEWPAEEIEKIKNKVNEINTSAAKKVIARLGL